MYFHLETKTETSVRLASPPFFQPFPAVIHVFLPKDFFFNIFDNPGVIRVLCGPSKQVTWKEKTESETFPGFLLHPRVLRNCWNLQC